MLEEINYHVKCYLAIVENMLILADRVQAASELEGLLTVTYNDMKELLMRIENNLK